MKSVQLTEGVIFMISDFDLVDASFWIHPSRKWPSLLHPRSLSYSDPPPPFPAPWLQELEFGVVGRDKRVKTWFACVCDSAAAAACPPNYARNPEKKRPGRFGRKGFHNNAGSYGESRPWKHKESIPPCCSFCDQIFWSINNKRIIIIRMWGR